MRARLVSISSSEARRAGESAAQRLSAWSTWQDASTVALFWTLPGEVDTQPLIDRAYAEGRQVVLPRMIEGATLAFAAVEATDDLRIGRHGVLEPDARSAVRRLSPDTVVLVPGLAFDREGRRLGRGAGYYDRALADYAAAAARPCFIGLAFGDQIVDDVPIGPRDVRMDGVVTEAEFVRPV